MKKKTIVALIIIVALVAGISWLVVTQKLTVTFNPQGSSASSNKIVCDDAKVSRFNELTTYQVRDDSKIPKIDESGLDKFISDVKGDVAYKDDATCEVMLFWHAYYTKNAQGAAQSLVEIRRLHDLGKYANNNLKRANSIAEYQAIADRLASPAAMEGTGGY